MQTTSSVTCPLPGLERVVITYNMMASEDEFEGWARSMGEENGSAVVVSVENWPAKKYGEPFGKKAPWGWRMWACKPALDLAMQGFLAGLTTSTALMPFSPPIEEELSSPVQTNTPT